MTPEEYARLWEAIDRATDPKKSPLMRARHKAFLMKTVRKLLPEDADMISQQINRINDAPSHLRAHFERCRIDAILRKETEGCLRKL